MAVRIWEEGYEYLDSMSAASTAGAVLVYDDGVRAGPWEDRPGQGQTDLIANEAARWMAVPREEIWAIRPPVPQQLFPPQYGYGERIQPTIDYCLGPLPVTPRTWTYPATR